MFVGHAQDCAGDTYHMFVPHTHAIQTSRNVQWMKIMHYWEPVQEPVGTIDSIELVNRAGVIGRIQGARQAPTNEVTAKGALKQGKKEREEDKGGTQTVPRK